MADPFVGQLMLAPYNFAPRGWAFCAGQLIPISQNPALFSLLGTQYGGNGTSNFALPNLQGCVPVGSGQGPGLSDYSNGETGGSETVTLLSTEVPPHNHNLNVVAGGRITLTSDPKNAFLASSSSAYCAVSSNQLNQSLAAGSLTPGNGQSQPHDNMMPYQVLNWFIALQGVFPSRG